jgi:Protein of unknown function (DUF3244).
MNERLIRKAFYVVLTLSCLMVSQTTIATALSVEEVITFSEDNWQKFVTRSESIIPTAHINGIILTIENPLQNCDITISIKDNEGCTVFEQRYSASVTSYITISLDGFSSGLYTLILRNLSGEYLSGSFMLNTLQ